MFGWRDDIRRYFDTAPEFEVYRKSNRGEFRVLRCEFPQLMGWSKLQRPPNLPRSLKAPYFSGTGALQTIHKDRISRPHVNRLKNYKNSDANRKALKKENAPLESGLPIHKSKSGELRANDGLSGFPDETKPSLFQWEEIFDHPWLNAYPEIKGLDTSGISHEKAEELRNETNRLLGVRRRMFRHFKLFREDRKRQPAKQATEIANLEGVLGNAQRFIGTRPYGIHEIRENVKGQHVVERLYKEEYWPRLYKFNPLKCNYLGINRVYCKPRQYPVVTNLMRLANKNIPTYGPPPPRKTADIADRNDLEITEL